MTTISKQQLIDWEACQDGLDRFIEQTNNTDEPVEVSSLVGGKNTISDLMWLIGQLHGNNQLAKLAIESAKLVQHLNTDPTVKKAIIAATECLDNPNAENINTAHNAYGAAQEAFNAAGARAAGAATAAGAAVAAASSAAMADAFAVATAAYCSALKAADADADQSLKQKLNDLLKRALRESLTNLGDTTMTQLTYDQLPAELARIKSAANLLAGHTPKSEVIAQNGGFVHPYLAVEEYYKRHPKALHDGADVYNCYMAVAFEVDEGGVTYCKITGYYLVSQPCMISTITKAGQYAVSQLILDNTEYAAELKKQCKRHDYSKGVLL